MLYAVCLLFSGIYVWNIKEAWKYVLLPFYNFHTYLALINKGGSEEYLCG